MSKIIAVTIDFKSTIKPLGLSTLVVDNNKENRGFAKAANLGVKAALKKGADKILLVNPDVEITIAQIATLAKHPGDVVSPVLKFERNGEEIQDFGGKVNFLLGRTTHNENKPGRIDYVSGACMLVDKKVFEKIGFFDERFFMYFEDVDFCLRAKESGFKIAVDPKVIVAHQISEHRFSKGNQKKKYLLASNDLFIKKWVPFYYKPFCLPYLVFLWLKTLI